MLRALQAERKGERRRRLCGRVVDDDMPRGSRPNVFEPHQVGPRRVVMLDDAAVCEAVPEHRRVAVVVREALKDLVRLDGLIREEVAEAEVVRRDVLPSNRPRGEERRVERRRHGRLARREELKCLSEHVDGDCRLAEAQQRARRADLLERRLAVCEGVLCAREVARGRNGAPGSGVSTSRRGSCCRRR